MNKLIVVMAAALLSLSSFAAQKGAYLDKTTSDTSSSPPGDSCGLGWQITQKKTLMGTSTRGTTNAFVPPTFGMTSGTIGCDQHQFAKKDQEAATFAIANFENLRIEMAEGRGENLAAFAQTLGCANVEAFGAATKANYRTIMNGASESPVQMYKNLKTINACGV